MASSVWSASDAAANGMTLTQRWADALGAYGNGELAQREDFHRENVEKALSGSRHRHWGQTALFHTGLASSGIDIANYLGATNYSFGYSILYGNIFASAGFSRVDGER